MGEVALIGMGSNLGDRRAILDAAIAQLGQTDGLVISAVSPFHETVPIGGPPGQGAFLNAAIAVSCSLPPLSLLERLHEIERDAGRVRLVRWGERTLDLDLLLFGDAVINSPVLVVPHPRMALRRFVLAPLEEIAPEVRDPITSRTIAELRANLDRRPSHLILEGWRTIPSGQSLFQRLVDELEAYGVTNTGQDAGELSSLVDRDWSFLGEQWLVSDLASEEPFAGPCPTFVVGPKPGAADPRTTAGARWGIPRLTLESDDPDQQISEILAACRATRG